jgi:hypothetical protein
METNALSRRPQDQAVNLRRTSRMISAGSIGALRQGVCGAAQFFREAV